MREPVGKRQKKDHPITVHAEKSTKDKRADILKQAWLESFRKRATILGACSETGVQRSTVKYWQKHDEAFARALEDADDDVTDILESSTMEAALSGDSILKMFLLKARRPQKYRDRIPGGIGESEAPFNQLIINIASALELSRKEGILPENKVINTEAV